MPWSRYIYFAQSQTTSDNLRSKQRQNDCLVEYTSLSSRDIPLTQMYPLSQPIYFFHLKRKKITSIKKELHVTIFVPYTYFVPRVKQTTITCTCKFPFKYWCMIKSNKFNANCLLTWHRGIKVNSINYVFGEKRQVFARSNSSDSCKQKITSLENIEIHVLNNEKVIGLLGSWMVSKKDFPNVGDVLSVKTPYRNWCIMLVFPTADAPRNTICSGLTFLDADIVVNKSSSVSIVFCRVTFPPQISAFFLLVYAIN